MVRARVAILPLPSSSPSTEQPTLCSAFSATMDPLVTFARAFQRHPDKTLLSPDTAFGSDAQATQGVFTIASSAGGEQFHYFVANLSALPALHAEKKAANFDRFYFTPWASDLATFNRLRPRAPIQRVVPPQIDAAAPSRHPPSQPTAPEQPAKDDDDDDDVEDNADASDGGRATTLSQNNNKLNNKSLCLLSIKHNNNIHPNHRQTSTFRLLPRPTFSLRLQLRFSVCHHH